jgi:hypothetical protein
MKFKRFMVQEQHHATFIYILLLFYLLMEIISINQLLGTGRNICQFLPEI